MNTYLARSLRNDLRDSIGRYCRCSSEHWHRVCAATCIASLLPVSFILQVTAFMIGEWVIPSEFSFACNDYDDEDQLNAKNCGVAIIVCSAELILVFLGLGVCVRSCMGPSDMQPCIFCYMCFIPTVSLVHGILSLVLCMVTAKYVADHKHPEYAYGFTFYVFLCVGCTTVVVSLISMCGYWCGRMQEYRQCVRMQEYVQSIASDDADRETTPITNAMH